MFSARNISRLLLLFFFCVHPVFDEPVFSPILPPSFPLAVRNPYLSVWLPGTQAANLPSAVPEFWTGKALTWSVMARVDGKTYSLFGVPEPGENIEPASVMSGDYTSTRTTFVETAGDAKIVLDFLSPISPKDYIRQSLPFSYLTVSVSRTGDKSPSVQIFSDIDNSWTGQFGLVETEWTYETTTGGTVLFTLAPGQPALYSEIGDMAQWGSSVYATKPNASNLTYQVGDMTAVRTAFIDNGSVSGPWNWAPGSVIAYSHDLGIIDDSQERKNITFVIGHVRNRAVSYLGNDRAQYWQSECSNISCATSYAMDDFEAAEAEARAFDASIESKANSAGGSKYSDIVSLSVRQFFGSIDITIPYDTLDTNDSMVFMKEISSNGNVNTMDVIYPASPLLYALDPEYIRLLLEPVVQYLASGKWPQDYTIHDMGSHYPNATGHDDGDAEVMPVEECGNILVLAYMYQKASNNTEWAENYDSIFKTYTDYLVTNALYPTSQLSTDDGAGERANQTNLAIKAAVALNAYGVMTGRSNYSDIGKYFANMLYNQAVGTDEARTHFTLIQGNGSSWTMAFNLFPDVLLELNTFPETAYTMQSTYYKHVRDPAGVALDSENSWGKTDWMLWAAATAMGSRIEQTGIRDMFVDDVHGYLTNGLNDAPFSDKYYLTDQDGGLEGMYAGYRARPVAGGHLALLAL